MVAEDAKHSERGPQGSKLTEAARDPLSSAVHIISGERDEVGGKGICESHRVTDSFCRNKLPVVEIGEQGHPETIELRRQTLHGNRPAVHDAGLKTGQDPRSGEDGDRCEKRRSDKLAAGHADQAWLSRAGGVAFRVNFSDQFTLAVATISMPSVMIAPIVIVSPVSPSKKKLYEKRTM